MYTLLMLQTEKLRTLNITADLIQLLLSFKHLFEKRNTNTFKFSAK